MFETAVVRARAADRRFAFLALSFLAHTAVVAAIIATSLASARLPQEAPKQIMRVFYAQPIVIPPALGTPRPVEDSRPRLSGQRRAAVLHETAPPAIPDAITTVAPSLEPSAIADSGPGVGVPDGSRIGVGTDAPPAPDATGPMVPGVAGVKAPVVIQRVEPKYPPALVRARMGGWVIVQCIIDKSGRIRDAQVIKSSFAAFEQPAIDAVQQWIFSPGTFNGQPVDTIFELTVKFEVR